MNIWSSLLALLFLSYTFDVVFSRWCSSDNDCEGLCCSGQCTFGSHCPCVTDSDCKAGETCDSYVCRKSYVFTTIKYPTFSLEPITQRDEGVWDSDCSGSQSCEDSECVRTHDAFPWGSAKVTGIVVFATVATIISCLYYLCRRVKQQQRLLQPPHQSPSTELALNHTTAVEPGSSHTMQATNVAVVDVEEFPLPPGAPPPYSSLVFNAENQVPSEEPPPSYDEALRTSQTGTA